MAHSQIHRRLRQMTGPLEGIRVLELSQIIAAPYSGLHLADLGAEVVKIEPPTGDGARLIGAAVPGESKLFIAMNRGKRGITLDLKQASAKALFHRIIPQFDVFLVNLRPGVTKGLGIDYDTLSAIHPGLVYVDSTGFGASGPDSGRSGSDVVMQAYSGLMAGNGKLNEWGAPAAVAEPIADLSTGLAMTSGVCAALYRRSQTGKGDLIETSLLNSALSLQAFKSMQVPSIDTEERNLMEQRTEEARARNATFEELLEIRANPLLSVLTPFSIYYASYPVKDGAIVLGALTPTNHGQMRRAFGVESEDPSVDPSFDIEDEGDQARLLAFHEAFRARLRTKTMDEWIVLIDREGAPASKVNFPDELVEEPQVEAMGYMRHTEHSLLGHVRQVGPIMRMRNHELGSDRPSPTLGEHTTEVLTELGIGPEEQATLAAEGAFG